MSNRRKPVSISTPQGVGIGLRAEHYRDILGRRPAIPWFEAISENFMGLKGQGGRPMEMLTAIRADYPVVLHGVSLNIGSTDPLNIDYLARLKKLVEEIQPAFVSDHLCWTGVAGENLHDLLPLPFNEEALHHVVERVKQVQDYLGRSILLENVSSYVTFEHSTMPEWEFLSAIAEQSDCGILLDVNNIYVSAINHGFDPRAYLEGIPERRVQQMHLAGYSEQEGMLIDTHDHPVTPPVWDLYRSAVERFGRVPTLIEWDENIPPLDTLLDQAAQATAIQNSIYALS